MAALAQCLPALLLLLRLFFGLYCLQRVSACTAHRAVGIETVYQCAQAVTFDRPACRCNLSMQVVGQGASGSPNHPASPQRAAS
jgi:hypothetical protein